MNKLKTWIKKRRKEEVERHIDIEGKRKLKEINSKGLSTTRNTRIVPSLKKITNGSHNSYKYGSFHFYYQINNLLIKKISKGESESTHKTIEESERK